MPPQLEKNHVVPTAWQDEALARDGVSREVPCSALKGERVPDSLPATPKSPPTRRVPPRGTPSGLVVSPCSPRDSQESSPTPQFKSINSSVLSFIHSPTLTSIQSVYSVTQLCPTLCNPTDCSTPGFPVHHQLLELAQTQVWRVSRSEERRVGKEC